MNRALESRFEPSSRSRILGRLKAPAPGPMLLAVASIHGNEPAGIAALRAVVAKIEDGSLLLRGDLLAIVGNPAAAEAGVRYIDEDLNRHWSADRVGRLGKEPVRSAEDRERRALFEEIGRGLEEARGEVVLLDLHTTSGEGRPFAVFADTLRSRRFARRFPVPAILGLEEQLEGTLTDYVGLLGHVAVAFEGGQHSDPASVLNLEAVVWVALAELAMLAPARVPVEKEKRRLLESSSGVPGILEVVYRHAIAEEDRFRMRPGHRSFEKVREGQVIADDASGGVSVPSEGFLLMPLYQKQGDDGFFVVRRVRSFWLLLSAALRTLRAGRIAHWLPGVSRVEGEKHALEVNRRVARWYSLEVLHLLGFRRRSEKGEVLIVERRAHDLP